MITTIKWKSADSWVDFPISDILTNTRNHAIDLFNRDIPVIILQGDNLISNDKQTRQAYHKDPRKLNVIALDKIVRSDLKLSEVGFV